jgi:NAD-dependent SIR2 family protein deacetylase
MNTIYRFKRLHSKLAKNYKLIARKLAENLRAENKRLQGMIEKLQVDNKLSKSITLNIEMTQ